MSLELEGSVFITGGAGTLGKAIIKRLEKTGNGVTIYSRDPMKHHQLKEQFPNVTTILGDIGDYHNLRSAMAGHDNVIHAAAMKHIPEGEWYPIHCYEVNVQGSWNVLEAAISTPSVKRVVGISTDKVCHPINAYGATKMMMERMFQEYARLYKRIRFSLVRYGNVLGSTGSVLNVWGEMLEKNGKINATDPDMTRFWITVDTAVDYIYSALKMHSGFIYIPKMPALSMKDLKEYVFGNAKINYRGLRPGEKMHEALLTKQEAPFAMNFKDHFELMPVVDSPNGSGFAYSSDKPLHYLTKSEILEMIA